MVAFEAASQMKVRELHAAALTSGDVDEGQPGFQGSYGSHFYFGNLCETHESKLALVCVSSAKPDRDDEVREITDVRSLCSI